MKEVEVKARIKDPAKVIAQLETMGCKFTESFTQSDIIFVPREINTLPTEKGVPVLRIRNAQGKNVLTMKIRLTNGLDKQESETEISNPQAMEEIILSCGFKEMVRFSKQRRKTRYQNWEICVDEVPGLGSFIEGEELTEDGDSGAIQAKIFGFLQTLGVQESDRESFGYDVIMWKQKNPGK